MNLIVKSRFKVENIETKMEFYIKESRFSVKSLFKESFRRPFVKSGLYCTCTSS